MSVSQTEGCIENLQYGSLEENILFLLVLKWNLEKAFSCVKTKTKSNFVAKLAERSNRSFSVYLMNHLFQASLLFNMQQWNVSILMDCMKIWKKSEVAKLLSQWVLILNWVRRTQFFLWVLREKKSQCICDRNAILFLAQTFQKNNTEILFFFMYHYKIPQIWMTILIPCSRKERMSSYCWYIDDP